MLGNKTLENFILNSSDMFFTSDDKGDICFLNNKAKLLLGNPKNLSELEHLFNFDFCIINNDSYFEFNPVKQALKSSLPIKMEVLYQISISKFKKFILSSWKENNYCSFSLKCEENIETIKEQLIKLESELKANEKYRLKAHSLALRNALINSIAIEIKDSLNNDEILEKALNSITNLLGAGYGAFILSDKDNKITVSKLIELDLKLNSLPQLSLNNQSKIININNGINEIIIPVQNNKNIFGYFLFAKKETFQKEEITLVETISAQISSALSQAELFNKIEQKNNELTITLKELKETEVKLIQSEKMASLGQLVAGVAHEINTPLGAINNNNSIFSKAIDKFCASQEINSKSEMYLKIIKDTLSINEEAISRITEIVKSLKNFARLDESEHKKADLHEGINNTILLIKHELHNKINIELEFAEIPLVLCYPNLLNQVFMNLIVNAIQSIKDKGTITIKTEIKDNNVLISFKDTGIGIKSENLAKVFDPGYTTKGIGVGTGLGLSICYQIIEKHNGRIIVNSQIGEGTTFVLVLPLV